MALSIISRHPRRIHPRRRTATMAAGREEHPACPRRRTLIGNSAVYGV